MLQSPLQLLMHVIVRLLLLLLLLRVRLLLVAVTAQKVLVLLPSMGIAALPLLTKSERCLAR